MSSSLNFLTASGSAGHQYTKHKPQPTLDLLIALLSLALFLDVVSQVLEQEDLSVLSVKNGLLGLLSNTVREEGDISTEKLGELGLDGLERVLLNDGSIRSTEVRHEDDRFGAWSECLPQSIDLYIECEGYIPFSMAYLMVGRAATIRYESVGVQDKLAM